MKTRNSDIWALVLLFVLSAVGCVAFEKEDQEDQESQENQKSQETKADPNSSLKANPNQKSVYFISPQDGSQVTNPITFRFGLTRLGIAPAGIEAPNAGHHHLLIDVDELPPLDLPIPKNEKHLHFGGGQSEATLELTPGDHTLQLLFADHDHVPDDPPVISEKITISVIDPLYPVEEGVYFITPSDNQTAESPLRVVFGLSKKDIAIAPISIQGPNLGHHHLLIDVDELPPMNFPIPRNESFMHFGGGETETTIELSPGKHTLQLLLGDHNHTPHNPPIISKKITVFVE